ncbi:hypothetical protein D3C81_478300 [compost metagenome]
MHITEPQVDSLLRHLQRIAEQAPVHLRPKRRQIVRGMRAALAAMADAPTLENLRDELAYELVGYVPEQPVVVRLGTPDPLPPLYGEIIQRLESGMSVVRVCQELGCTESKVHKCRDIRAERDQWKQPN